MKNTFLLFTAIGLMMTPLGCSKKKSSPAANPAGFSGYLSMSVTPPTTEYGFGFSFYATSWPLVTQPLQGFQIGLPSTWLEPNNSSFTQYLCPSGSAAYGWAGRSSNYYRDVFQTIEGGMGTWGGNQFPTANPKYSMNGTPDCYNDLIGSPGWNFFSSTTSLPAGQTGIIQLSNRILVPPDGMTLDLNSGTGLLGISWMALNLTSSKTANNVPVGTQNWTLFLNSTNFSGPVAFWIPDTWTRLSQSYSTDQGRGLDALPGYISSFAMEFNSVPYLQATDNSGNTYVRIPSLQFPLNGDGTTHLVQDVYYYSSSAFTTPVTTALNSSSSLPTTFASSGAMSPSCTPDTLNFSATSTLNGGTNANYDFSSVGSTVAFTGCSYGITWAGSTSGSYANFPEYYKLSTGSTAYQPVTAAEAPSSLTSGSFALNSSSKNSYISSGTTWTSPGPTSSQYQVTLSDGSKVTYQWYLFKDQPALQGLGLSAAELNALQATVTSLQAAWSTNLSFQAAPSSGSLISLDAALLVTPPSGMETGYVPIVVQQSAN